MLERELQTYDSRLSELLGQHRGQYVLIKDDDVVDTFVSVDDALKRGYEKFEAAPFLVKQVLEIEVPQNFTSFQLGA